MEKRTAVVLVVIFGGLVVALLSFSLLAFAAMERGGGFLALAGFGNVGVVEVKGPIVDSESVVEDLTYFREQPQVRAVILRIDSPGGSVGPSQEIFAEVRRLAGEKVVVASMGAVAASGGYYVALPATRIVANPGTITGSIGVITQVPNVEELAEKIGFRMNVVASGPSKDAGNPFRPFTEEDRRVFRDLIDDVYRQFVEDVAQSRNLPVDEVRRIADGRVYTGAQALELGLVDELGNFTDAIELAADLADIPGKPELAYPPHARRFRLRDVLIEGAAATARGVLAGVREQLGGDRPPVEYRMP